MISAATLLLFAVVSPPSTHGFVVHNDLSRQTAAASHHDASSKRRRHHPAWSRRRKRHGTTGLATSIFSSNKNIEENAPTTTTKGPLDAALTWLISDTGSVLLGSAGLIALLVGRTLLLGGDDTTNDDIDMAEAMVVTTRETLLAVVAIGAVLLNGLSQLDVPTALAEKVVLDGVDVPTARLLSSSSFNNTTTTTSITTSRSSSMAMTSSATDNHHHQQQVGRSSAAWGFSPRTCCG
jgi:hypothetical protein